MPPSVDDIDFDARQGSVAAISHLLNQHFNQVGLRICAAQENGILHLLIEASTAEQLPKTTVVDAMKAQLEAIGPQGITQVNINGRLVQDQQLLWLDEAKHNPEHHLLWTERITLKRPNPWVRLYDSIRPRRQRQPRFSLADLPHSTPQASRVGFWRGLIGGASLALLLLLVGSATKDWLRASLGGLSPTPPTTPEPPAVPPSQDPFVLAVRIAQQAGEDGQSATTAAEWLDLAVRWQRASELMAAVPPADERYPIAQDRVATYANNKTVALERVARLQSVD